MKTPNDGFKLPGRFSPKQAALAEKIANDVNEGIDGQEPRHDLRMAIAYWADAATVEARKRATIEADLAVFMAAKGIFDALVENRKARKSA